MAKKRANGEGNIRKRKDGRWEGRYTAGYDPETGKRIIKPEPPTSVDSTYLPILTALATMRQKTRPAVP